MNFETIEDMKLFCLAGESKPGVKIKRRMVAKPGTSPHYIHGDGSYGWGSVVRRQCGPQSIHTNGWEVYFWDEKEGPHLRSVYVTIDENGKVIISNGKRVTREL